MRRGRPHPALTEFRLCKEFGWTPRQLEKQPAKTIEGFIVILNEVDRQTEEEMKKAKPLTNKEWDKIRLHPVLGYGLIKEIKLVDEVGNIILYHHERFDGHGYPDRLKNEKIPIEARIFALADALDAITSHRPYRKERSFKTAQNEIQANAGSQFDPRVVEAFSSVDTDIWEKIRYETTKLVPHIENFLALRD